MKFRKRFKFFRNTFSDNSLLIFVILIVTFFFLITYYLYILGRPSEPIAAGDFPTQPVWVLDINKKVVSTPLVDNDFIYVRTIDSVCKILILNQEFEWCVPSPSDVDIKTTPLLYEDLLIIPEKDSRVAVFYTENGELLWRAGISDAADEVEALSISEGMLFVARHNQMLTAYNLKTGKSEWAVYAPDRATLYLTSGGKFIYLAGGKELFAYSIDKGKLISHQEFNSIIGPILSDDRVLFITTRANESILIAMDIEINKELWRISINSKDKFDPELITLSEDVIYISGKKLVAINKNTYQVHWIDAFIDSSFAGLAVLNNHVFVKSINKRKLETIIVMLERNTGVKIGQVLIQTDIFLGDMLERNLSIYKDLLIIPFGDDRLYAYRP